MQINKDDVKRYLENKLGHKIDRLNINLLGKGCLGVGYLVEFESGGKNHRKILKSLYTEHLGKDHFSDRAQSLLLANSTYASMDRHVRSMDVVAVERSGNIVSVGDTEEFFIFMDEARGIDYFHDLKRIGKSGVLTEEDKRKAIVLAEFLVDLHKNKVKGDSLYKRKIRDTIGGGESIMGVMDMYPEKLSWFPAKKQVDMVKRAIDYWMRDKYRTHRLTHVHGDFHPGNIWFENADKFMLLDRARGEYGEAADDVAAILINYIFYSLIYQGNFDGAFKELFRIFTEKYFGLTKDKEMGEVIEPYWVFRVAVICNIAFYPDAFYGDAKKAMVTRKKMIKFAENVLRTKKFDWKKVNNYLK